MGDCAKLASRYCGPFEILDRVGLVAYKLAVPPIVKAHNVFHVFLLNKYVHDVGQLRQLKGGVNPLLSCLNNYAYLKLITDLSMIIIVMQGSNHCNIQHHSYI